MNDDGTGRLADMDGRGAIAFAVGNGMHYALIRLIEAARRANAIL